MYQERQMKGRKMNKVRDEILNGSLLRAKRTLYGLLTQKNHEELTDYEVEVMYYLSLDEDIQFFLKENL